MIVDASPVSRRNGIDARGLSQTSAVANEGQGPASILRVCIRFVRRGPDWLFALSWNSFGVEGVPESGRMKGLGAAWSGAASRRGGKKRLQSTIGMVAGYDALRGYWRA